MIKALPPFFFVLALLAFIAAFAFLAMGPPEPGMAWHQARLQDNEDYRKRVEEEFEQEQLRRKVLIGILFGAGGLFTISGFVTMRPT